jgi:hypothetical protein
MLIRNAVATFREWAKVFPSPADSAMVPGPSSIPTPQFPIRPAFLGVGAKALRLKYCAGLRLARTGFPTQSGRSKVPRLAMSVLDWSSVGLMIGVSHGPVCSSVTVLAAAHKKVVRDFRQRTDSRNRFLESSGPDRQCSRRSKCLFFRQIALPHLRIPYGLLRTS